MKKIIYTIVFLLIGSIAIAQVPEPAKPQEGTILLTGGTAHLGDGTVIEKSLISIVDGKIGIVVDATVARIDISQFSKVIDISGKHIYPGLILPNTTLGLVDVNAVRATRDFAEVGGVNPNVRALIAYNTDSELIATLRYNGILLAQATPQGGIVSGTSSIMKLDGWNWEDAAYKIDDGVHLNWPRKKLRARWWLGENESRDNPGYDKTLAAIDQIFNDAKSYISMSNPPAKNIKLEAMRGLIEGTSTLFIHSSRREEIIESIQWAKKAGITKLVLVDATDALYVADFLKENKIPVLLDEVHRLPGRTDDDIDLPYRLPGLLHEKGVLVGLTYSSLQSSRNLPFFAGTVSAYGLDKEESLKLITSNTAKILGIDNRTGTIKTGLDANLVISEGDLLDMRTSILTHAFIEGRQLNLDGKQQLLFDRFKEKYESQN